MRRRILQLSLVIPCRDKNDPKLKELLASIESQDFPRSEMEILVITEGTSESAKAIGIKRAKGEVIGILASDNVLTFKGTLREGYLNAMSSGASYPFWYALIPSDDILNRYFALIGGNDVLSYYMKKNDRMSYFEPLPKERPIGKSFGDNGFFVRKELIEKTDLDNYYHVDNANEIGFIPYPIDCDIWHKTGGNIFKFFTKRYRYGLQHAFNPNRRWHLVEKTPRDIGRLIWFIFVSVSLLPTLFLSIRGYLKIKDVAWFMHPLICLATVFTYGLLMVHLCIGRLFQLLSVPMAVQKA